MNTTAPRPLDRLWAHLKPKVIQGIQKLKRRHTARKSRPRPTPEDMERLHERFRKDSP